MARTNKPNQPNKPNKNVSRETPNAVKENIADLGEGYQAAYALMSMADEEPETERELQAREAAEEQSAASQFAALQKQLGAIKPASPFQTAAAQGTEEPVQMAFGGLIGKALGQVKATQAAAPAGKYLEDMTEEERRDFNYNNPYINAAYLKQRSEQRQAEIEAAAKAAEDAKQAANSPVRGIFGGISRFFGNSLADAQPTEKPASVPSFGRFMRNIGSMIKPVSNPLDPNVKRDFNPEYAKEFARRFQVAPQQPVLQGPTLVQTPMYGVQPQMFNDGGEASAEEIPYEEKGIERKIAERIGLAPAWDAAEKFPEEMGFQNDAGTKGDAARHMMLMRGIEQKYGPYVAKAMGYAHEAGNVFDPSNNLFKAEGRAAIARDWEMDTRNNALGLELSKQAGGDDAKFRELVRRSLDNTTADFYKQEYSNTMPTSSGNISNARKMLKEAKPGQVRKRAEGSPEEGETKSTAKDMLKEVGRSTQYVPYDLIGAPVDVINLGLKGIDYVTGSKLATEKPVGGSEYLIDKANKLGIADKPTGSMTETLTRLGTGLITPGGAVKASQMAARPLGAAKKMFDGIKIKKMAPGEIDPAVAKEIRYAKTGPTSEQRTSLLPTAELPFVGQLERIAADMNPATVEQFRNMVANTGRDYEIDRLNRALEGLGPKDKITSKVMLERLENTLPPSRYRSEMIEPEAVEKGLVDFHQSYDNPYPSKKMGTINLRMDKTPEEAMSASYFGNLQEAMLDIKNTEPITYASGEARVRDYDKAAKDIAMFLTKPEFKNTPLAQMFQQDLPEITRLRQEAGLMEALTNTYLYPTSSTKTLYKQAYPELKDMPEWRKETTALIESSRGKNEVPDVVEQGKKAEQIIQQKVLDKVNELYGVDLRPQLNTPEMQALDPAVRTETAKNVFAKTFASDFLTKQSELNQVLDKYKSPAFEQITQNMPYAGTHTSIVKDNPISFSRFVDIDLPDNRKAMLMTELQSDRFKAVKEGKASEVYPGMAKSPQVIQQLMIKNAVQNGIKRDTEIILFPGSDSTQAQLYEKLPNNIKAVLKDLGPGFKMEKIAVPNEKGDIIERYGITWDKKAAERLQKQGVRFAKGGLVEKKY
jgi:hypothetical protein